MIVSDKPWACLNCKARLTDEQTHCPRCKDRVKSTRVEKK